MSSSSAPIDSAVPNKRSGDDMIPTGASNPPKRYRDQQTPQGHNTLDDSKAVAIRNEIDTCPPPHLPLPPLVSRIPGLNKPLDYVPPKTRLLPTALEENEDCNVGITTLREFRMLHFMNEVTDQDNWHVNIMNDDIANQWIREVQEQQQQATPYDNFSERMAQYCLAELRWRAKQYERTSGMVFVYNGDVFKSDTAISAELHNRLLEAVGKLESSIVKKVYEPYSEETVWNLVHPSMFPLVFGKSRILRNQVVGRNDCLNYIACGEVIPEPADVQNPDRDFLYSDEIQMLPCDVHLNATTTTNKKGDNTTTSTTTTTCQITSYINNLHPQRHADLYAVLEEIIAAALPLWNASLRLGLRPEEGRYIEYRIPYDEHGYNPDPVDLEDFPAPELYRRNETAWLREHGEWAEEAWKRCLVYPEPFDFEEPDDERSELLTTNTLVKRFAASGLQVIVKLTTIELTPDKPVYEGGPWRVKGRLNEHICASALYYYSTENITKSHLGFQQNSNNVEGVLYSSADDKFLEPIFGTTLDSWQQDLGEDGTWFQDVGSVWCKEGRLLTFPNILKHRVHSFELADKTRPGHLKLLALDLVDPNIHILSTARVPPQRQDWWCNSSSCGDALATLSPELQQHILSMLDVPMTVEVAESLRRKLR